MKKILCLFCVLCAAAVLGGTEEEDATLVKTGQAAPEFRVTTLDGKKFDLKDAKGKVVLVNFFATWCGPCMAEMPHLQAEVWSRFNGTNFVMVAIDRGETGQVVADFQKQHTFGFPIACDTKKEVYSRFATKFIPRNFLIDASGTVVFESVGYGTADFEKLVAAIQKEIRK